MRSTVCVLFGLVLAGSRVSPQEVTTTGVPSVPSLAPGATPEATGESWTFSVSVFTYMVGDGPNYAQPTLTADRGWLHLEARYNYEALETGSAWIGYNLSFGDQLALEFTPMLGGVFGAAMGVAPGYEGELSWWKLALATEGEYVFDTGDSTDSFFYSWSELTLSPMDWFRVGLAAQRTRVYASDREVQRGFVVGFTYKALDLSAYLFNPDDAAPTAIVAVAITF